MRIVTETGWYAASRSAWKHYIVIPRGHLRIRRKALCGQTATTWAPPIDQMTCVECRELLGWVVP